ncbi:MAG: hypothetical protein LBS94_03245 [Prevotellaceae bacterium]|nr:hypothetical protein [Prevotellaceae bacterium]
MKTSTPTSHEQAAEMLCERPTAAAQKPSPADIKAQLLQLLMQAPTWTDAEYHSYLQARKHLSQLRTQ